MGLSFPIFGMVKDNRHRTRALVTPDGAELSLTAQPAVFALIGRIQEETHRFAITYHRLLRSRHVRASALEKIAGIGPKRRQDLLRHFKSVGAIRAASIEQLAEIVPQNAAEAVWKHFHDEEGEKQP